MRARVARVHRSSGRRDGGSCGSRTTPTPKNDPKRARTRPSTRPEPRENRDLSRPFFIGYSMIPAGARWVVQNIYLTTTNCSSRSASSGFKTVSPLSHVHIHIIRIYILLGFLPDILTSFSSFYIYFFFIFLSFRPVSYRIRQLFHCYPYIYIGETPPRSSQPLSCVSLVQTNFSSIVSPRAETKVPFSYHRRSRFCSSRLKKKNKPRG